MRIVSWNINGLRSVMTKGFSRWLARSGADVVGLQEVRAREEQVQAELRKLRGWHRSVHAAERAGYSGVGLLSRRPPDELITSLAQPEFDSEGRHVRARFQRLLVVNCYFPNGSGKDRDNSRIPYKLAFYQHLFAQLEEERRRGAPILVMGDFNTAHQDSDLARPRENRKTSGFTDIEREELDRWLRSGWSDTFRRFHPEPGHYSWWSQRQGVREKNIGWRIDYVLASPGALPFVRDAFIHPHVLGSDHCPVGVDLDDGVLG